MAGTRILWGRILLFGLTVSVGTGYLTYPRWKDELEGTAWAQLPAKLSVAADAGLALLSRYLPFLPFARAEALTLLPDDTIGVAVMKSPEQLSRDFAPILQELESSGLLDQWKQDVVRNAQGKLQTEELTADYMVASGYDLSRPMAAAVVPVGALNDAALVVLMPTSDEDKAFEALKQELAQDGHMGKDLEVGSETLHELDRNVAFVPFRRHLVMMVREKTTIAWEQVMAKLGTEHSLDRSPTWKAHERAHREGWQVLMMGDFQQSVYDLLERENKERHTLGTLKPLVGSSGSLALWMTNEQVAFRVATRLPQGQSPESLGLNIAPLKDPMVDRISGDALGVLQFAVAPKAFVQAMERDPSTAQELERLRQKLLEDGVSLDKDIVNNLTGELGGVLLKNPAVSDSDGPGGLLGALVAQALSSGRRAVGAELPVGGVVWVGMKEPQRMKPLLERAVAELEQRQRMSWAYGGQPAEQLTVEEQGGVMWYELRDNKGMVMGLGLTAGQLVLVMGEGVLAQVKRDLAGEGKGFMASLPQRARAAYEQSRTGYFYLDVPRTLDVLEESGPLKAVTLKAEGQAAVALVEHSVRGVAARGWVEDPLLLSELVFYAPEQGYAAHIRQVAEAVKVLEAQP